MIWRSHGPEKKKLYIASQEDHKLPQVGKTRNAFKLINGGDYRKKIYMHAPSNKWVFL